ncbi:MAG: hypothetical protein QOI36_2417, partial [Pseudonocardiales bacterium]|nr:hypothetical protein [Pseudonocardiales bacterium]
SLAAPGAAAPEHRPSGEMPGTTEAEGVQR